MVRFVLVSLAIGCADPSTATFGARATPVGSAAPDRPASPDVPDDPEGTVPGGPAADLEITFLGVGGYLIRSGDDVVMTPPLYTNPDFFETTSYRTSPLDRRTPSSTSSVGRRSPEAPDPVRQPPQGRA